MIPYGRHEIDQDDIDAVVEVLRSDRITQGGVVPQFEGAVADLCGAKHAVAVNSATSALHVSCLALGLGAGDRLWTVPNTFVASANCARYCGAAVDFVDIDERTLNISVASLSDKLVAAKRAAELPKIVVPVAFGGQPVDQEAIAALGREFGFKIVEDSSHAIGGRRHGEAVGSARYADVVVFSFHPVKIITSGEGGMALTNDSEVAHRMQLFRSHGVTRDPAKLRSRNNESFYYEQLDLGYNYRLTDIHAALGLSQLRKLSTNVERRNQRATRYKKMLSGLPIRWQEIEPGNLSAYHLFVIQIDVDRTRFDRNTIFNKLVEAGIGVNVHYSPVHLQPYYRDMGFAPGQYPVSEAYASNAITLPLFPTMTDGEQDHVVSVLRQALQ
jgi:UDP-4-amino-4,6-dideoxy-N-acetyl-beta-L-altrosamine transaminase